MKGNYKAGLLIYVIMYFFILLFGLCMYLWACKIFLQDQFEKGSLLAKSAKEALIPFVGTFYSRMKSLHILTRMKRIRL